LAAGRYIADRIPGARMVELPGVDHLPYFGDVDSFFEAVREFLRQDLGSSRLEARVADDDPYDR
jgi:pimeloyl-ACP methyl ester carboxylesterase